MRRGCAACAFGTVTMRRPLVRSPEMRSPSTNSGSRIDRSKLPVERSAAYTRISPSLPESRCDRLLPRVRRLDKRWARLHRLIHVAAVTGTIHYLWAVKKDTFLPLVYLAIFAALLGDRVVSVRRGPASA